MGFGDPGASGRTDIRNHRRDRARQGGSTFCLDFASSPTATSAPSELDSDCMEHTSAHNMKPPPGTGGFLHDLTGRSLLYPGPGGLGLALEEELAMLAGEQEDCGDMAGLEAPLNGQDPDLLSLIRHKEKDLLLAARLGKALLERNQDLTRQYENMHKDLTEQLELLEQEKHELRRRCESREGEWESRVAELEGDVQQLQEELEQHQAQLREVEREKSRAVKELSEQNQRLMEQLSRAAVVERELSVQVHVLRDEFREKSVSTNQHMSRLESLQAEIKMLSERKRELERHVGGTLQENEMLQNTIEDLQERTRMLERQSHDKDLQLRQNQLELQEVRLSHRQLAARMEELSEERSLQSLGPTSTSLLSEIEQSMEAEELEQEREQLRLQLWEAFCQVRSLCSHLRGNDVTDSALSTDSSMDESSETSSAKDVPTGSLDTALHELKRLTQNLLDGNESMGSRRSDEEALEEQVRKLAEESRTLRELYESEQSKARASQEEALQLHNQATLLSLEMSSLKEERERLRAMTEEQEQSEQVQRAIHDRDEAIEKKAAVEMELAKCKIDIMALNSQLLDAIQQKVNLSQQLEAWQDDMQRVIDQQLIDKHQEEWSETPYSFSKGADRRSRARPHARLERAGEDSAAGGGEGKSLFSFFKKN
ncbi:BICD family-like cargo adapter 1 isoform X2 [Acipenser oxyrinchus oxyrinchus]|uniref:BICD family-like cargo adapter 1 isoform X2 n=1 Tax=Acipenser oxyrinchus oxyrinchus TaxID=40147 RepID=A0AAD8CRU2_ACIOX|nr:BICD family-like cargo adapter 1 isoform X2 [Acipenser oxyrinchus oxyrinchus]